MRFTNCLRLHVSEAWCQQNLEQFVPKHNPVPEKYIKFLEDFLIERPKIMVLTGAGISTESGIPDYRSEGVGMYARTNSRPVQHIDFLLSHKIRQRYWARNFTAWPRFSNFQPNSTHHTIARFEHEGRISGLVTQNVDQLHHKAGSRKCIELHGHGYTVICVGKSDGMTDRKSTKKCDYRISRHEFQEQLSIVNERIRDDSDSIRPDGDVDISQEYIDNFQIPSCPECGGNLKPEIVFFGDNVPRSRTDAIADQIGESDGLLVLGSSLLVFSGYRIVLQTHELGLPVAIVNIGPTRGDHIATVKLSAKCGDVIPKLFGVRA